MNTENRESRKEKRQRPSLLDEVLERRMLLYVLAAGATLAGASGAAHAKVVFTPSNVTVSSGQNLQIDLNNDGTADFSIGGTGEPAKFNRVPHSFGSSIGAWGATASDVMEGSAGGWPLALRNGQKIGSNAAFIKGGEMALYAWWSTGRSSGGNFLNTTGRFLGVRFLISGQVHYGWIGFRYVGRDVGMEAQLLGWAYETQPNTPIIAGSGQGSVFPPSSEMRPGGPENAHVGRAAEPTSLELLAAGHVAVADWRRRNAAVVAPVASPS